MTDISRATKTEAGYDAVAADFAARSLGRSSEVDHFRSRFVLELAPKSLVVDLGCGPGADIDYFEKAGHHAVALDRSMSLLQLVTSPRKLRADLGCIPIAGSSVDALWSHASLLHIEPDALAATFDEWQRVLRPGGVVAFVTSLGGDSGWELAPAASPRVPTMTGGTGRWFVHHEEHLLLQQLQQREWTLVEVSRRESHRDWMLAMARTSSLTNSGSS